MFWCLLNFFWNPLISIYCSTLFCPDIKKKPTRIWNMSYNRNQSMDLHSHYCTYIDLRNTTVFVNSKHNINIVISEALVVVLIKYLVLYVFLNSCIYLLWINYLLLLLISELIICIFIWCWPSEGSLSCYVFSAHLHNAKKSYIIHYISQFFNSCIFHPLFCKW